MHTVKWIKWSNLRHSEQVLDLKQKLKTIFSRNNILCVWYTLTCLKSDPWSVPSFSGRRNYFEDAPEKSEDALRSLFTCVGRFLRGTLFPWGGRFLSPYDTCCAVPCLPSECSQENSCERKKKSMVQKWDSIDLVFPLEFRVFFNIHYSGNTNTA